MQPKLFEKSAFPQRVGEVPVLDIVKHIAKRHRGTLTIRSGLGEGTSVEVSLPLAG